MLTIKALAKINLTLEVLGKRPDGYHKGKGVDLAQFSKVVTAYYKLRKCDPNTGLPATAELSRLGLDDVAAKVTALMEKASGRPMQ